MSVLNAYPKRIWLVVEPMDFRRRIDGYRCGLTTTELSGKVFTYRVVFPH